MFDQEIPFLGIFPKKITRDKYQKNLHISFSVS